MGCTSNGGVSEPESTSKEFDYCFRQDEITFINEAKKEKEDFIKNGGEAAEEGYEGEEGEEMEKQEKDPNALYNIYKKFELDLSKKEKNLKEYLVLYIPESCTKDIVTYEFTPVIDSVKFRIELSKDINKHLIYGKINNDSNGVTKFKCIPDPEIINAYRCSVEYKLTQKDKETRLITLEACYSIKPKPKYGLVNFTFHPSYELNSAENITVCYTFDDNYMPCFLYKHYFDEISKYKLYAFNKMEVGLTLRDKRIKLKIENELDKGLLSKFTPDEIDQINNSLNTMEIDYSFDNLIYQKVIHNIKNKKNYTTVYDIVLSPNNGGFNSNSGYESDKPLIIKQFKINNKIVKKEKKKLDDEPHNSDEEEKVVDGYYVSDKKFLGFFYCFRGTFGLYEFECESNDGMDYFRLNCNDLGNIMKRLTYGSSYKYEIILNGNKIKFLDEDFKYKIENDKIILKGIIDGNKDNYNEEKFVQLAKKNDRENVIGSDDDEFNLEHWTEFRFKEFVPDKMKLA